MRISDWRSDVCSSDLVTLLVEDDGPNADGGEGGSDDMLVYDETPGLQTGEETSDLLPLGLDAVVSDLLQTEELEAVCGAARDTIFFDYGLDQPIDGGEGLRATMECAQNGQIGRAHDCNPVTNATLDCPP